MAIFKKPERTCAFCRGFWLPLKAARLLWRESGVKRYAILPLVANILLYAAAFVLFIHLVSAWQWGSLTWEFWWGFGAWLSSILNVLLEFLKWPLLILPAIVACYFTFTAVGLVIASPINDILSERMEQRITHPKETVTLPLRLTANATLRSLVDSLWIAVRQTFFSLLVLPLLLIPVVGAIPLFIVGAYYAGLGFVDVGMARNYFCGKHKKPLLKDRYWELMGFGAAMQLLFMIPFVGLLVLPVGVTAGTMLYCNYDWRRAFAAAGIEWPIGFIPPVLTDEEKLLSVAAEPSSLPAPQPPA